MSFRRVIEWTCDWCGVAVTKEGFGLPLGGWVFMWGRLDDNGNNHIKHQCPECVQKFFNKEKK